MPISVSHQCLTHVFVLTASAAGCAMLILLLLPFLERHAMAHPNARSSHIKPTAQGGGVAVVAATTIFAPLALAIWHPGTFEPVALTTLLLATLLLAIVGGVDDVRPIGILPRLFFQSTTVFAVLWTLPAHARVLPILSAGTEWALLFVAYLWFVNLVNFMDGIDCMVVVEVVPITGALAILGLAGVISVQEAIVAVALGGAILGFAPFNRPVARLFLGDVGSLPIGLLLGWLLIMLAARGHLTAALLLPLYFLLDASFTLLRRVLKGEPFWRAHRSHFYQRAVIAGLPVGMVVARVFAINIGLAVLAIVTVLAPVPGIGWASLAVGCLMVGSLLWWMNRGR